MPEMWRVGYIAGPMAGRPGHGYADFAKAAAKLRSGVHGQWIVNSPHEGAPTLAQIEKACGMVESGDFRDTDLYKRMMRRCCGMLLTCEVLFALPEWYMSQGATFETEVARMVGIEIQDGAWLLDG